MSYMDAHAEAWGRKAVYLIKIIRGHGRDLPDWQFDKWRREAVADAKLAARAALLRCDCAGGHPVTGQHEPFCNLA